MSKYGVISGPYFRVFGSETTSYLDTFHAVIPFRIAKERAPYKIFMFNISGSEYNNPKCREIRARSILYLNLFVTNHLINCLCSFIVSDYPSWMSGGFGKRTGRLLGIPIYFVHIMTECYAHFRVLKLVIQCQTFNPYLNLQKASS